MSNSANTPNVSDTDYASIVPCDAASLIIIDHTLQGPYVLMGKRHENHVFMPGQFVFPGGRLEACDSEMVVAGSLHTAAEHKLMLQVDDPSPLHARALALAAIRETFEETGLMIGSTDYGPPDETPEEWHAFADHGVFPELDMLHFVARAITPPRYPRRFDARFFAVDAECIAHTLEDIPGPDKELVEMAWVSLSMADSLNTPAITQMVMQALSQRLEKGLMHEAPVPFFHVDASHPSIEL